MSKNVLLNNIDHKDLRVITTRSAAYGDDVQFAVAFCWEFRAIQAHYPILFKKVGGEGDFAAVALFGFQENENLFLAEDRWDANYIPLSIQQKPFLIGFQQSAEGVGGDREPVVHVDLDSPRISKSEGEPVFLAHGGVSDYLEGINSVLHAINEGYPVNEQFLNELADRELLESVALDIVLNDGSQNRLMGFYTINEEALAALDGDALSDLNEHGFLVPIYMAMASLANIPDLIERKNMLLEH